MKKRTRFDSDLPKGFRYVRVGEKTQASDRMYQSNGAMLGEENYWCGHRSVTSKLYVRKISK